MPLDAAIGRVFAQYRPGGRHGHRFWRKKSSCGIVKLLFKASVQKAQNVPSTQLIEATSCVKMSKPRLKPKSTANFLAIKRYQRTKIIEFTNHQRSSLKSGRS